MQFEEWASENLKHRYLSLIKLIEETKLADKCTIPFVPYWGSAYGDDNKPKMLFIGKATFGWGKGDEGQGRGTLNDMLGMDDHARWEHLVKLPKEFIEDEIIPFYGGEARHYYSQFWNRIYRLTGKLLMNRPVLKYKREEQASEKCFRSIAWSNVFKVGALKSDGGNPNKKLIDIQKEENKKEGNPFEEEINVLKPDVAIFSTGPSYDRLLEDMLPKTKMRKVGPDHLAIKEIEKLNALAFRTYHFRHYSNHDFKQVVDYICGRMNGTVTEG
jgi:hypothetical protein